MNSNYINVGIKDNTEKNTLTATYNYIGTSDKTTSNTLTATNNYIYGTTTQKTGNMYITYDIYLKNYIAGTVYESGSGTFIDEDGGYYNITANSAYWNTLYQYTGDSAIIKVLAPTFPGQYFTIFWNIGGNKNPNFSGSSTISPIIPNSLSNSGAIQLYAISTDTWILISFWSSNWG